jgi:signal transduction histidine kinase
VALVTNAILYSEPGGWVEVVVSRQPALCVRNTGQRGPAEAVPALFEPFRRLTAERVSQGGGAGLGLSIVRSITSAHGSAIDASARTEGGLHIEIDFPPAQ